MNIRRMLARAPRLALAHGRPIAVAAAPNAHLIREAAERLLAEWPLNAGPFFVSDGQSAVAFAALWETDAFKEAA